MFRLVPLIARRFSRPGILPALILFALAVSAPAGLAGPQATAANADLPALTTGQGSWRGRGPHENGWGASAIYDPIRNRMVAYGGQWGSGASASHTVAWELSLDGPASWTALTTMHSGPWGRQSHSAIYDPVRDRMVVFGGYGSSAFNDIWELSLSGIPTWTQIVPALGPAPQARQGHTAIYDPIRDRMIVYGGSNESNVDLGDVWSLSLSGTPTWTQLTPTGTPPIARGWHSAIYDPLRDRMVMFAGWRWATSGSLSDLWSLSLSGTPAWSVLAASGLPPARNSHSAIYDPLGDRMVSYGGWIEDLTVLSFSGTPTWSILTPTGTPPSLRDGAPIVYDAPNHRIVMYGGLVENFGSAWAATLGGSPEWTPIAPVGAPPGGGAKLIRDPPRDRMVAVIGGSYGMQIWTRPLGGEPTWTQITPTGTAPSFEDQFSATRDPIRDRIVFCGNYESQVWVLSLDTWEWSQLDPPGDNPPGSRTAHSAIYDPVGDRLIVYGGSYGSWEDMLEEIWALPLAGGAWAQITPIGAEPIGRDGHTAIYDPVTGRMVICGGHDGFGTFRRDVWAFDFGSATWTEITPAVPLPKDKVWGTAVYDSERARMLIFGGNEIVAGGMSNELWALSLSGTPVWTQLDPPGAKPLGRQQHGAIYDPVRDRMVVFGGIDYVQQFHDVWEYTSEATVSVAEPAAIPGASLALGAPSPNPSRAASTLAYTLGSPGRATLEVFDAAGRRVRRLVDQPLPAGTHHATWRGDDDRGAPVASGLYFARLRLGGEQAVQRILRLE